MHGCQIWRVCRIRRQICNARVPDLMNMKDRTPNLRCTDARFDVYPRWDTKSAMRVFQIWWVSRIKYQIFNALVSDLMSIQWWVLVSDLMSILWNLDEVGKTLRYSTLRAWYTNLWDMSSSVNVSLYMSSWSYETSSSAKLKPSYFVGVNISHLQSLLGSRCYEKLDSPSYAVEVIMSHLQFLHGNRGYETPSSAKLWGTQPSDVGICHR